MSQTNPRHRYTRTSRLAASFALPVLMSLSAGKAIAQDTADSAEATRAVSEVDRRAKHLYDKAIELMEYKQYERGLAMLDTVIRDNQGNLLGFNLVRHAIEGSGQRRKLIPARIIGNRDTR